MSKRIRLSYEDMPIVPPPSTMQVHHDHRVVLFTPNGDALVRKAGFMQTSGTFPALSSNMKTKGGKKSGGKKGKGC